MYRAVDIKDLVFSYRSPKAVLEIREVAIAEGRESLFVRAQRLRQDDAFGHCCWGSETQFRQRENSRA